MEIKLSNALAIKNILSRSVDKKLSIKLAYKIMTFIKNVENDEEFYNNKIKGILLEYSQRDDSGQPIYTEDGSAIKILGGKEKECEDKVKELEELTVKIPDSINFSLEELEELECTARELYTFDLLIK